MQRAMYLLRNCETFEQKILHRLCCRLGNYKLGLCLLHLATQNEEMYLFNSCFIFKLVMLKEISLVY